ncbi:MAG: hypothetical protein IPK76_03825 [Lewinellaceae bacterium]|nr:hypothetical protein [Lewinellaceae bacterium]
MNSYFTSWTQKIAKGMLPLACMLSVGSMFGANTAFTSYATNTTSEAAVFLNSDDHLSGADAPNEIAGTVFRDYNANGVQDGADPGIAGVSVAAFDDNDPPGTPTATATSGANGAYLLTGLTPGAKYRLEFSWLDNKLQPGAAGGTSVQIATAGATGVNMGLTNPNEYCQDNPKIVTSCYLEGPNTGNGGDVLIAMNFNTPVTPVGHEATGAQIGTTYGLAYQRSSDIMFAAAFQKRFSGFGPGGPGAIYRSNAPTNNATNGSVFLDLNALFGSPVAGTDPHVWTLSGGEYTDNPSFNEVGRMSFGDLEISEDELSLYVINLKDRSLYIIPLGTDPTNPVAPTLSSEVTVVPLADPGSPLPDLPAGVDNAEIIPFGLKVKDGLLYIGFVGNGTPLVGFVYAYDPIGNTFTKVLEFPLDFNRGCAFAYPGSCKGPAKWNPWISSYPGSFPVTDGFEIGYPQPMMTDIEFDVNGNMLIGMRDRWGEQGGFNARNNPGNSNLSAHDAFGDILKAPYSGGAWTLNVADFTDNTLSFGTSGSGEPTWNGDFYFGGGYLHEETAMGGLGVLLNTNQVAMPSMDPLVNAFSNGVTGLMPVPALLFELRKS